MGFLHSTVGGFGCSLEEGFDSTHQNWFEGGPGPVQPRDIGPQLEVLDIYHIKPISSPVGPGLSFLLLLELRYYPDFSTPLKRLATHCDKRVIASGSQEREHEKFFLLA
ncbi:hypothetical protein Y1Q_0013109 [Alligator mississippiensis]|uniref:Uncharacterized protein n=1 Tax=Alligator mississippiensis TaxID=8496 RepID=A0A151NGW6_ALLMI|nr:hypothetical protein Y1Q_0013109 [Alligator mississippiensis]